MFTVENLEDTDEHKKENINHLEIATGASQVAPVVKSPPANAGDVRNRFDLWVRKIH